MGIIQKNKVVGLPSTSCERKVKRWKALLSCEQEWRWHVWQVKWHPYVIVQSSKFWWNKIKIKIPKPTNQKVVNFLLRPHHPYFKDIPFSSFKHIQVWFKFDKIEFKYLCI
jgi:hypothetical protein